MVLEEGVLTVNLPSAELALVQQALEKLVAELPEDAERDYFAARADALVAMAQQILAPRVDSAANGDNCQVLVHVDADALDGQGGESDLPLPTVKRLCCDGGVVPVIKRKGEVLDVGRKQRVVPTAMKRALLARVAFISRGPMVGRWRWRLARKTGWGVQKVMHDPNELASRATR